MMDWASTIRYVINWNLLFYYVMYKEYYGINVIYLVLMLPACLGSFHSQHLGTDTLVVVMIDKAIGYISEAFYSLS